MEVADVGELKFPGAEDFHTQMVHGYGKVAMVEEGMEYIEDNHAISHWKVHRGIVVRSLGVKGVGGVQREPAGEDGLPVLGVAKEGSKEELKKKKA